MFNIIIGHYDISKCYMQCSHKGKDTEGFEHWLGRFHRSQVLDISDLGKIDIFLC